MHSRDTTEERPEAASHTAPSEAFCRYFDVVPADTPGLRDEAYRLRYQVYCVENPFLDPAQNPGEREIDEFDHHSVQSLLIHRATGAYCGAVRLILQDPSSGTLRFPFQTVSPAAAAAMSRLPRQSTAEVSRFAVSKAFRRRAGESRYADAQVGYAPPASGFERRLLPHITLGLMRAILLMSIENGITHLCAVMDPALLRLIARFGLNFEPAGDLVEYHGPRQPCFATLGALVDGVREVREDMWIAGTQGGSLLAGLSPAPCIDKAS